MIEVEKKLYLAFTGALLFCIVLLGAGYRVGVAAPSKLHIGLGIVVVVALAGYAYMKARGRILTLVAVLMGMLIAVKIAGWEQCKDMLFGYVAWLFGKASSAEVRPGYELLQVMGIACLCFGLQVLAQRFAVVARLLTGAFLLALLIDLFFYNQLGHMCVVCVMGYTAMVYTEWTQQIWKKEKGEQKRVYMVWILPFMLLYLFFMFCMPVSENPYDWGFAKNMYAQVRESCIEFAQNWQHAGKEDFVIAKSGFSGTGMLLGTVLEDGREVMRLQGQKSLKTNVYLVGKVYDTFDGTQWQQMNEVTQDDRVLDTLETLSAVRAYDSEQENSYLHTTKLDIHYRYFHTGYLFTPLKAYQLEGEVPDFEARGGNLVMPKKQGYGTQYQVRFLQMNVDHPLFYEFLERTEGPTKDTWLSVQKDLRVKYPWEALEIRNQKMQEIYGLPPLLSPEVTAYLEEITQFAATPIQKLKAIEAELAGFTYTTSMQPLPEEITTQEAFLDYMLLEKKEGFCSYFATAFVLLARAEGIPARYVEGFCVPVQGEQETKVYANMAHAWPEVYLEGVGWIPFEPTPGYARIRYTPWEIVRYQGKSSTQESEQEIVSQQEPEEEEIQTEDSQKERERERAEILLYGILLMVAAGAVFFLVDALLSKRRDARKNPEQKFQDMIWKNLKLLEVLGYQRKPHETLEELQKRSWAVMQGEEGQQPLLFTKLYEEVIYGNKPVSEEMLAVAEQEERQLLEQVRKWRKAAYFYFKYFRRW